MTKRRRMAGYGANRVALKRCLALLGLVLVPGTVSAQATVNSWPGLNQSRLPTVYVLDDTGSETQGKLLRLDADSLVILAGGTERRFDAAKRHDHRSRRRSVFWRGRLDHLGLR
jgi:hypothetical protein